MDIVVGCPGNVHNARILANSSLYSKAERGELFPIEVIITRIKLIIS